MGVLLRTLPQPNDNETGTSEGRAISKQVQSACSVRPQSAVNALISHRSLISLLIYDISQVHI